jgi:hypothetical protein
MENPDEIRSVLMEQAKIFKSSWVDLAKALSLVAEKKLFEAWGYRRFEDYCSRELHIRRQTVEKLVGSYLLLGDQASGRDGGIPDLESMHLLAKARKDDRIDNETFQRLKENAADRG